MYQEEKLVFYYAVSPIHMGAGTATGAIDNPIQREVHTGHPVLAGSGIKGALRHHCAAAGWDEASLSRTFGPERSASLYAGAVAFTDAQLVAFPVRSLKETFVYATCPSALARLQRMVKQSQAPGIQVGQGNFLGDKERLCVDGKLILEAFEFQHVEDENSNTARELTAKWLADVSLPKGNEHKFFREKLEKDLVVLNDTDFGFFVRNSTVIEPHVCIDNDTGAAKEGGLFYTENLPPESILAGKILATVERHKKGDVPGELRKADQILQQLLTGNQGINGKQIQVGGDATTGRGLLLINAEAN